MTCLAEQVGGASCALAGAQALELGLRLLFLAVAERPVRLQSWNEATSSSASRCSASRKTQRSVRLLLGHEHAPEADQPLFELGIVLDGTGKELAGRVEVAGLQAQVSPSS